MKRTLTLTLTLAQYEALASAVADHDLTLEDRGWSRERKVLDRAWRKVNAAWYRRNHTDGSAS